MEEKRFLTPWGLVLCGIAVLAAGALSLALSFAPKGAVAIVEQDGQVVWEKTLSQLTEPETITVEGDNGIQVVIQCSSQGAAVISSTCPDQVCVKTGQLTRSGESALCLPAKVTLRLEGSGETVDATVY